MPSPDEPPSSERDEKPWDPLAAPGGTDDDAIILWMLSLSPEQRLAVAEGFAQSMIALQRGRTD
ncbi:MAG: hypothetical protein U0166_05280 [Acidobacteriota bacterium]